MVINVEKIENTELMVQMMPKDQFVHLVDSPINRIVHIFGPETRAMPAEGWDMLIHYQARPYASGRIVFSLSIEPIEATDDFSMFDQALESLRSRPRAVPRSPADQKNQSGGAVSTAELEASLANKSVAAKPTSSETPSVATQVETRSTAEFTTLPQPPADQYIQEDQEVANRDIYNQNSQGLELGKSILGDQALFQRLEDATEPVGLYAAVGLLAVLNLLMLSAILYLLKARCGREISMKQQVKPKQEEEQQPQSQVIDSSRTSQAELRSVHGSDVNLEVSQQQKLIKDKEPANSNTKLVYASPVKEKVEEQLEAIEM